MIGIHTRSAFYGINIVPVWIKINSTKNFLNLVNTVTFYLCHFSYEKVTCLNTDITSIKIHGIEVYLNVLFILAFIHITCHPTYDYKMLY